VNEVTKQLLTTILSQESAWDKKTRALKYDEVITWLGNLQDYEYFYGVYWPCMLRAVQIAKAQGWPPGCFQEISVNGEDIEWFCDDWVVDYLTGPGGYLSGVWYDLYTESPSQEDILALGIRPTMVPGKEGQPALF